MSNIRREFSVAKNLTVGVVHGAPNVIVTNGVVTGGLIIQFIKLLAQVLNLRLTYRIFPFGAFTEVWDSLIANEIDFEGVGFIPDSADYIGIDYLTSNIFDVYMAIIVKQPSQQDHNEINYTDPYPLNVWLSLLALWVTTCIFSTICDTEVKTLRQKIATSFMKLVLIKDVMLRKNSCLSMRIMVATYFFYTVIISAIYNSLLISKAAVHENTEQYETLEDLLQDNVKFGIHSQSNYVPILKAMQFQPFKKLYKALEKDIPNIVDSIDGYRKASTEKFAFVENSVDAIYTIRDMCELDFLPTHYLPSGTSMAFPNNSSLKEPFSRTFLLFRTTGILKKETENYISMQRPSCQKHQSVEPLMLKQVTLPFYLIIIGVLASIVMLGSELIASRYAGQGFDKRPRNEVKLGHRSSGFPNKKVSRVNAGFLMGQSDPSFRNRRASKTMKYYYTANSIKKNIMVDLGSAYPSFCSSTSGNSNVF